jgi:hypothetical protein
MSIRLLLALALFTGFPVDAQEPGATRTLKSRSIAFQIDGKIPMIYAHSVTNEPEAPGVPVKVKTYLNHEVENLQMNGDRLVFTTSGERSSIKKADQIIAKARIPEKIRSAVLMFLPGSGKEGDPKYRVMPIEDTIQSFPRGSFKVINLSPMPLRITLEKKIYDIKAGGTRVIEDPPVNKRNASAMRAYNKPEGEWRNIGATSWPHPGTKRVIHLAFYNPNSKKVELRGIRDIAVGDAVE